MAKKKNDMSAYLIPGLIVLAISAFHYFRLRSKYITNDAVHQIFDLKSLFIKLLGVGGAFVVLGWVQLSLYRDHQVLFWLALPLTLYLINLIAKAMAFTLLGVLVDHNTGVIYFPVNIENLKVSDFLKITPILKLLAGFDSVNIAEIKRITRQAGKRVILLGDFGSRRVDFSDKALRDECIFWITSYSESANIDLDRDIEYSGE